MRKIEPEFRLNFDPKPSRQYPNGYWYCFAEPGFDGVGATPIDAMGSCLMEMSRALLKDVNDSSA